MIMIPGVAFGWTDDIRLLLSEGRKVKGESSRKFQITKGICRFIQCFAKSCSVDVFRITKKDL